VRLLFVKQRFAWPRSSGHDVYTYYTMKACAELGHSVSLALGSEASTCALEGLQTDAIYRYDEPGTSLRAVPEGTRLQRRFRSFFGVPDAHLRALAGIHAEVKPEAVICSGLDILPHFAAFSGGAKVWWAADELAWHHLSQLKLGGSDLGEHLRNAVVKALYERAHSGLVDRTWVVTDTERRAMRWLAGMRHVDVVSLGVDACYFSPTNEPVDQRTMVFWGRLNFGPNVQALEWFFQRVWPLVRAGVHDARFTIIGFQPTDAVRRLASVDGVTLMADVPDLRSIVCRHALVVLPFVSGGGMKNKLLEAAALGMPIVCTPAAASGLSATRDLPLAVESRADRMARQILGLWSDENRRRALGVAARDWVVEHYTWTATARKAIATLERQLNP
jgi:polysaccharide biosynthesis protein PslH